MSKDVIRLLLLAIICMYLMIKEYRKTNGDFLKAKIFHLITCTFIIVYHFNAVGGIIDLLQNYNQVYFNLTNEYSGFLGMVNLLNYFILLFFSIILMFLGAGLAHLMEPIRKLIVDFILIFIPLNSISVYTYGLKNDTDHINIYLFGGIAISIFVYGSLSYLYRQQFMIDFFNIKAKSNQSQ